MSDDFGEIRPKSVPLSHGGSESKAQGLEQSAATRRLGLIAALGAAVVALGVVFFVVPDLVAPPASTPMATTPDAPNAPSPASSTSDSELPPYQTLLREQARQQAQDELARFVELQLTLEDQMQVGDWGMDDYDLAKTLATAGDEEFLREEFDASIASYKAASAALTKLIATGEGLFEQAMSAGWAALDARDEKAAQAQFASALTIHPKDSEAQRGYRRAQLLPEVNVLMRQAKNFELAGESDSALAVYEQVRGIDRDTYGLDGAIAETRRADVRNRVNAHLSDGFSALERGRLQAARSAFGAALKLHPGNAVALGGLEQVTEQTTNTRIEALRQQALAAEQAEAWQTASDRYAEVLSLDGNIRFARAGRTRAAEQARAALALSNIAAAPEKLSSKTLFAEAEALLAQAMNLEPRGPKLAALLAQTQRLIEAYRHPVAVTLLSDNETQVTLSTVGQLGSFERKQVNLRPGAYTLIGSRDGCRDVRQQIVVRADMRPIEIRCVERL